MWELRSKQTGAPMGKERGDTQVKLIRPLREVGNLTGCAGTDTDEVQQNNTGNDKTQQNLFKSARHVQNKVNV